MSRVIELSIWIDSAQTGFSLCLTPDEADEVAESLQGQAECVRRSKATRLPKLLLPLPEGQVRVAATD